MSGALGVQKGAFTQSTYGYVQAPTRRVARRGNLSATHAVRNNTDLGRALHTPRVSEYRAHLVCPSIAWALGFVNRLANHKPCVTLHTLYAISHIVERRLFGEDCFWTPPNVLLRG
jgi:hypothetical protein